MDIFDNVNNIVKADLEACTKNESRLSIAVLEKRTRSDKQFNREVALNDELKSKRAAFEGMG
jgi:hypothetical protein